MSRWALPAAAMGGLAFGIAARLVDNVAPRWVGDMAAVWVLAAFCAGGLTTDRREGARLGIACLVTACAGYYVWRVWVDGRIWADFLLSVGVFWFVSSLFVGGAAGFAGALSRRDRSRWAIVSGAFIGEAIAIWILGRRNAQILIELGAGAMLLLAARAHLRRAIPIVVAIAMTVALAGVGYRLALSARKALRRSAAVSVLETQ